jgi:hypothetical protein
VAVLVILLTMAVGNNIVARADTTPSDTGIVGIDPYWANTDVLNVMLSFNNGQGALSGAVYGKPAATSITATAVLERLNTNGTYSTVYTWNNLSATGNTLLFSTTYYVTQGYTYRLTITATVYMNGVGETVSGYQSAYAN